MFIYMNPFIWGMRRLPQYESSPKTERLIEALNKKYSVDIWIESNQYKDTLWYFRDVRNQKVAKLKNLELGIEHQEKSQINMTAVKNYFTDFRENFEHRQYFDSTLVKNKYDSVIYKTGMK